MFEGKAKSLPIEHLKGALLMYSPALSKNIRLGWKGLPVKNTLAYYEHLQITTVKSFITLGTGPTVASTFKLYPSYFSTSNLEGIKLFTTVIYSTPW
jgi:hypothetical protein